MKKESGSKAGSFRSKPAAYYGSSSHKCGPCHEDKKREYFINISNSAQITQTQQAEANGGPGGSGGSAAAAGAIGEENEVVAVASSSTENENENEIVNKALKSKEASAEALEASDATDELENLQEDLEGTNTITVSASGGSGGGGGAGGANDQSQSASITIDNCTVIMLSYDGNSPGTALSLGRTDRQVDVKIDADGNTFVNGKKMDEVPLEDGTKVFIFRDSESKTS